MTLAALDWKNETFKVFGFENRKKSSMPLAHATAPQGFSWLTPQPLYNQLSIELAEVCF